LLDLSEEEVSHQKHIQDIARTTDYKDLTAQQAQILRDELEEYRLTKKVGYHKIVSGQAADVRKSMERCREEVSFFFLNSQHLCDTSLTASSSFNTQRSNSPLTYRST
jgi:hypothetical protein